MKKLLTVLSVITMSLGSMLAVQGATVKDDSKRDVRSYYDSCDQIFRIGEYAMFGAPNSDVIFTFTVDAVDAANDKIYSEKLGNWLPAYPLMEVDDFGRPTGDQIFRVGEKFAILQSPDNLYFNGNLRPDIFKVYNVDAPTDSIQIHLEDKWGNILPVWVYAAPVTEYSPTYCN